MYMGNRFVQPKFLSFTFFLTLFAARKLEFIDCETYLGNQSHCIGMDGSSDVKANRKTIDSNSFHVLRKSFVTVIADCNRREVRWEVDGKPYPFIASFEKAGFPKLGGSFRFAVGGGSGGKTKIVSDRIEALLRLKEIEDLSENIEVQKMKNFLERALLEVESGGADRDFRFNYDLESADKVAQLCNLYIHGCGFEDCASGSSSSRLGKGSRVTLSPECTDFKLLKPGDVGEIIVDDGSERIPFKVCSERHCSEPCICVALSH